jgi:membrane associated rhomboid family serine protease
VVPVYDHFVDCVNTFIETAKPLYLQDTMTNWQYWGFMMNFYFTPKLILAGEGPGILSAFTSMFMHGDFIHLLGNMGALWVFGRRVEDACGAWRFLVFYLVAGMSAHLITTLVMYNSPHTRGGGERSAFRCDGGLFALISDGSHPHPCYASVLCRLAASRAGWVVLYFLGRPDHPCAAHLFSDASYGVGYWAHLGGFFSALFIFFFLRPEAFARYLSETLYRFRYEK